MTAMREAYEEAGIEGYISMTPIGSYPYIKRLPKGREQAVQVDVYGLQVSTEHLGFPEMHERTRFWVSPAAATEMVDEPELKALNLQLRSPPAAAAVELTPRFRSCASKAARLSRLQPRPFVIGDLAPSPKPRIAASPSRLNRLRKRTSI